MYIPTTILNQGSGALPTPPVAGPLAWYDATVGDSIHTSGGSEVSLWLDLSGNGYHAFGPLPASRPTTGTRTINGLNALDFVFANGDYMVTYVDSSDRTQTRFIVALVDALSTFQTLWGGEGGSGAYQSRVNQTTGAIDTLSEGITNMATSTGTVSAGVASLVTVTLSATDVTTEVDGTADTDANATTFSASRTMRIGIKADGFEGIDGLIGELLVYDGTMASGDRNTVEAYLKSKWGTP